MNTCNTTIENGILQVKTEKSIMVQPQNAILHISFEGVRGGSSVEEVQRVVLKEKQKLSKEISSIIQRDVTFKQSMESVAEREADPGMYWFSDKFEILVTMEELLPMEKWKRISNVVGEISMNIFFQMPDLEKEREEAISQALLINSQIAEMLAKKANRMVTWPKSIQYSTIEEIGRLRIRTSDSYHGGRLHYKCYAENQVKEFSYELKEIETIVSETVSVEWIIV